MARISGIKNVKMLLLMKKPYFSMQGFAVGRCMSKLARTDHDKNMTNRASEGRLQAAEAEEAEPLQEEEDRRSCWMPHHRTGIYIPKGTQEWVMEDVPNNAASFDCTFWIRSIDGVDDKPDPDINPRRQNYNPN